MTPFDPTRQPAAASRSHRFRTPRNRENGIVYYIACTETNRVKIGFTAGDPMDRLRALRTGAPTHIRLMAMHWGTQKEERKLHKKFDHLRLHGEWFAMAEDLAMHMFGICWMEAAHCSHQGQKAPAWAKVALETLQEGCDPLPDHIRSAL